MAVWALANQETFREIGNLFRMNRGNSHPHIFEILKVIATTLKSTYITWPTASDCQRIAAEFESVSSIPNVVGCIDGTHIPIRAPGADRDSYISRKGYPSINVLAVCDNAKRFTYFYADRAGSVHDARVLRVSSLGRMLENGSLDGQSQKFHLLGDSAYPLLPTLLVPYLDNGHLTASQTQFNRIHSSTRSFIERQTRHTKPCQHRSKQTQSLNYYCVYVIHMNLVHASIHCSMVPVL